MAVYPMPIVLMIEADSAEEAQRAIDDWCDEISLDNDLPNGTEDLIGSPDIEYDEEEDRRVLYLAAVEDSSEKNDDDDNEDDFSTAEEDF